jgi:hypothetical protein
VIWRRLALPHLRRRLKGKKGVNRHASPYRLKNYAYEWYYTIMTFDFSHVFLLEEQTAHLYVLKYGRPCNN